MSNRSPEVADAQSLHALHALRLVDALDPTFQEELRGLTEVLACSFAVPVCLLSMVDGQQHQVLGGFGGEPGPVPLAHSFCATTVALNAPLVVPDMSLDPRFADNPLVRGDGGWRFYAGFPLAGAEGQTVGTLALLDRVAHEAPGAHGMKVLTTSAAALARWLLRRADQQALLAERALLAGGPMAAVIWKHEPGFPLAYRSDNLRAVLGDEAAMHLEAGEAFEAIVHPADRLDLRNALRSHLLTKLEEISITYRVQDSQGAERWVRQISHTRSTLPGQQPQVWGYLVDETRQKRMALAKAAAKERLALALESSELGTFEVDYGLGERKQDHQADKMMGFRADELETGIDAWNARIHPFDRAEIRRRMADAQGQVGARFVLQYRFRHNAGHWIWLQSYGKVVAVSNSGETLRIVGTIRDITERQREASARVHQQQLLDVLNRAQSSFMLTRDLSEACDGLFEPLLAMTESHFGFVGVVRHGAGGQPYLLVPSVSSLARDDKTRALFGRQAQGEGPLTLQNFDSLFGHVVTHGEVVLSNDPASHPASRGLPLGAMPLESFLGLPIRLGSRVIGMVGLGNRPDGFDQGVVQLLEPLIHTLGNLIHARDLDDARQRAEAELARQATTDELTGLANRREFMARLQRAEQRAQRNGQTACLALVDLDHFKRVNDEFGHAAGDQVLRHFAAVATAALREVDLVGRVGGEEFAVLLPDTDLAEAHTALERLRQALADSEVATGAGPIRVTLSAGLCVCAGGAVSLDHWMAEADRALYTAKSQGRNRIALAGQPVLAATSSGVLAALAA